MQPAGAVRIAEVAPILARDGSLWRAYTLVIPSGAEPRRSHGITFRLALCGARPLPGQWVPVIRVNNTRSATIVCPLCGFEGSILDHRIATDGTVSPSVACPREGCTFHDRIHLNGWE